jgi:hypothetical protein
MVLSGKLNDQIDDFGLSMGWELGAGGVLASNQRSIITNLPFRLRFFAAYKLEIPVYWSSSLLSQFCRL